MAGARASTGLRAHGPRPDDAAADASACDLNLSESTVGSLTASELMELARGDAGFAALTMGYGDPAGAPALRNAIGLSCGMAAEQVVSFAGTTLGLYLVAALGGRGEAVLVTPCFSPSREALERAGLTIRPLRLRFAEGYRLDPARLAACLGPQTRILYLADPQNPSGVRVPRAILSALLAEMARRAPQALLFLDETYREATHGGPPPPSAASLDPRIITAGSLSKAHGAPGLRVGWLTVPQAALRARLVAAKASLVVSGSVLDEALAAIVLRRAEALLAVRRQALGAALGMVLRWHAQVAGQVDLVRPDAGGLCCLRLRLGIGSRGGASRFWAALPRQRLRLAPGPWFGESNRVFRLGFGHPAPAELAAALQALSRALEAAA